MTDGREDVTDRVADRFETEEDDSQNDKKAQKAKNAQRSQKDLPNVKEAWSAKSVYLPDGLLDELGKAYKQLDLNLDDDLKQFEKTRHFYPLLIMEGIERVESMESSEIIEQLEGIDPDLDDYLPDP
jgi:hypothetical protein